MMSLFYLYTQHTYGLSIKLQIFEERNSTKRIENCIKQQYTTMHRRKEIYTYSLCAAKWALCVVLHFRNILK